MEDACSRSPIPNVRFLQAGDYRVCFAEGGCHVASDGNATRPRILLLHGWCSSHRLFRGCWQGLAEIAHYCALDLVGFGDSDKPVPSRESYRACWYAEQVKAFADALGWDTFVLLGHSMGGAIATEFALAYPHYVERLILVDTVGAVCFPPLFGRVLQLPLIGSLFFRWLAGTRKSIRTFLLNDVWYGKAEVEEEVLRDMQRILKSPSGNRAAYTTMMRLTSPRAVRHSLRRFGELTCKTHLIWGAQDRLFPLDVCAKFLVGNIPGATLEVIDACGHEPPVERPLQFLQALQRCIPEKSELKQV